MLFGSRIFYFGLHIILIGILLCYENNLRRDIRNHDFLIPIIYFAIVASATYFFLIAGRNPGFVGFEKTDIELQQLDAELNLHISTNTNKNDSPGGNTTRLLRQDAAYRYDQARRPGRGTNDVDDDKKTDFDDDDFGDYSKTRNLLRNDSATPEPIYFVGGYPLPSESDDFGNFELEADSDASHKMEESEEEGTDDNNQFKRPIPHQRMCSSCKIIQNFRTRHCKACQACVAKFDHHCFWIGSCVGELNHRLYWWMLFSMFLEFTMSLYFVALL